MFVSQKKSSIALLAGLLCIALLCGIVGCRSRLDTSTTAGAATAATAAATPSATAAQSSAPAATPTPATTAQTVSQDGKMAVGSIDPDVLGFDPLTEKVVALTYDDGPNPINTVSLLAYLKEENVRATFFMLGSLVANNPDVVQTAYEQGCEIGNHSYDHSQYTKLTYSEMLDEQLERTDEAIRKATGAIPIINRAPYGENNDEILDAMGEVNVLWSVDTLDWESKDPDAVLSIVQDEVKDGSVILMHDIYETTGQATRQIVPYLKEQGYHFVTVTQMVQIYKLRGESPDFLRGDTAYIDGDITPAVTPEETQSSASASAGSGDYSD